MASYHDIEKLKQGAKSAGDDNLVATCSLALDGDEAAHRKCERVISETKPGEQVPNATAPRLALKKDTR